MKPDDLSITSAKPKNSAQVARLDIIPERIPDASENPKMIHLALPFVILTIQAVIRRGIDELARATVMPLVAIMKSAVLVPNPERAVLMSITPKNGIRIIMPMADTEIGIASVIHREIAARNTPIDAIPAAVIPSGAGMSLKNARKTTARMIPKQAFLLVCQTFFSPPDFFS